MRRLPSTAGEVTSRSASDRRGPAGREGSSWNVWRSPFGRMAPGAGLAGPGTKSMAGLCFLASGICRVPNAWAKDRADIFRFSGAVLLTFLCPLSRDCVEVIALPWGYAARLRRHGVAVHLMCHNSCGCCNNFLPNVCQRAAGLQTVSA